MVEISGQAGAAVLLFDRIVLSRLALAKFGPAAKGRGPCRYPGTAWGGWAAECDDGKAQSVHTLAMHVPSIPVPLTGDGSKFPSFWKLSRYKMTTTYMDYYYLTYQPT